LPGVRIGVLALQGGVAEHLAMLRAAGAEPVQVRRPESLEGLGGLVLPGGESTTLMKLRTANAGVPVWGTCAGAVLLSSRVSEREHEVHQPSLGIAAVHAVRNRFGRQVDSFQEELAVTGLDRPFPGVFIRAPLLAPLDDTVEVLASVSEGAVFLRCGTVWLSSFHPELTSDSRLHRRFVRLAEDAAP